ncbi:MAG: hypothetical protein HOC27_02630 [Phycisphaerae bacterium]|jgi:hypothetical protein|nr:hypothetical protein [Phycisphaerae bacterium]
MNTNKDTNTDKFSQEELCREARMSKNRVRVQLLNQIHNKLEEQKSMETAHGYNPLNDMSFTGEFEAIGA